MRSLRPSDARRAASTTGLRAAMAARWPCARPNTEGGMRMSAIAREWGLSVSRVSRLMLAEQAKDKTCRKP